MAGDDCLAADPTYIAHLSGHRSGAEIPNRHIAMGIMLLASLSLFTGTILDTVTRGRKELRMLTYLQCPPPIHIADEFTAPDTLTTPDIVLTPSTDGVQNPASDQLLRQIWRFGLVGVAGFIVNAGLVESSVLSMGPVWAQALPFPAAVSVIWVLNRRFTFGASQHRFHQEWLRYIFANLFGWGVNNGVYLWMIFNLPLAYRHPALAVAGGSLAGMVLNFSSSRLIVFKK